MCVCILCSQISGALVHIAKGEGNHENGENEDRHITITGNKDSISVAKYLIEMRYIPIIFNCYAKEYNIFVGS